MTTDPDLGPCPAWLVKVDHEKPVTGQDDLYGRRDILVAAGELDAVTGQIRARGGHWMRLHTVLGQNARWRLEVNWPRELTFLDRVNGAVDWPPKWIFEQD